VLVWSVAQTSVTRRKSWLIDCNPRWGEDRFGTLRYLTFDCPESHVGCVHTIPFTPGLDGVAWSSGSAMWTRTGETFETMTLSPSIKRFPVYKDREEAIAKGCLPEYVQEWMFCRMHVNLIDGLFQFSGDSS
jgi:hypothetical protein